MRTELIPSFEETLGTTTALISAEDYFQVCKTELNNEFQCQMEHGIYILCRLEEIVLLKEPNMGSTNVALGTNQQDYGDQVKTVITM